MIIACIIIVSLGLLAAQAGLWMDLSGRKDR